MIESTRLDEHRLLVHRAQATFTLEDLTTAMSPRRADRSLDGFDVLWDLREAQLGITLQQMNDLNPARLSHQTGTPPGGKSAWVVSSHLVKAMIEAMYDAHPWPSVWAAFVDHDAALVWLQSKD